MRKPVLVDGDPTISEHCSSGTSRPSLIELSTDGGRPSSRNETSSRKMDPVFSDGTTAVDVQSETGDDVSMKRMTPLPVRLPMRRQRHEVNGENGQLDLDFPVDGLRSAETVPIEPR